MRREAERTLRTATSSSWCSQEHMRGLKPGETRTLFIVRKQFESQISLEEIERLLSSGQLLAV